MSKSVFFLFFCFFFVVVVFSCRTLCCFLVYSTRRFVVCLSVCHFVLVFFSPFSIAITSLGEERANLSAFCTFVRFVLVWICQFPLPLGIWEGLRFVIVALPGLFSYLFFSSTAKLCPFFDSVLFYSIAIIHVAIENLVNMISRDTFEIGFPYLAYSLGSACRRPD